MSVGVYSSYLFEMAGSAVVLQLIALFFCCGQFLGLSFVVKPECMCYSHEQDR